MDRLKKCLSCADLLSVVSCDSYLRSPNEVHSSCTADTSVPYVRVSMRENQFCTGPTEVPRDYCCVKGVTRLSIEYSNNGFSGLQSKP